MTDGDVRDFFKRELANPALALSTGCRTALADFADGSGQARAVTVKPSVPKRTAAKPKRKPESPTVTDDFTGKFLRVGNKLCRTSDDKKPIVRLEPDRLKTSNIDALPDIVRRAKANGWTSLRINGGDKFKKAAYLAAAAQGLAVENYTPSKVVKPKPSGSARD